MRRFHSQNGLVSLDVDENVLYDPANDMLVVDGVKLALDVLVMAVNPDRSKYFRAQRHGAQVLVTQYTRGALMTELSVPATSPVLLANEVLREIWCALPAIRFHDQPYDPVLSDFAIALQFFLERLGATPRDAIVGLKDCERAMTGLNYACSYFDVPTGFACKAQRGEPCMWPDGSGGRIARAQFHDERVEAERAMNNAPGEVPSAAAFDAAVAAKLYE